MVAVCWETVFPRMVTVRCEILFLRMAAAWGNSFLRMATVRIRIHLFDVISSRLQLLGVMIWSTTDTFSFQEAQWIY
jgi:hypothetical protein